MSGSIRFAGPDCRSSEDLALTTCKGTVLGKATAALLLHLKESAAIVGPSIYPRSNARCGHLQRKAYHDLQSSEAQAPASFGHLRMTSGAENPFV